MKADFTILDLFSIPIRDLKAVQEKILYLYEHPEIWDEMAQAALRRVQSLGGWNIYGEQMLSTYKMALGHQSWRSVVGI